MTNGISQQEQHSLRLPAGVVELRGDFNIPDDAHGLVIFAHGSGSSRRSSRNRAVAAELNSSGLATLLFDLLTEQEEIEEAATRHLRFDIPLLTDRLSNIVEWAHDEAMTQALPIGLFGASTGAAAALGAAANHPSVVQAVVSRGGRPDLAGEALPKVKAPTLLIVGGNDRPVIGMNEEAAAAMHAEYRLDIIPGATHLFEEPGALEKVSGLAKEWFNRYLDTAS